MGGTNPLGIIGPNTSLLPVSVATTARMWRGGSIGSMLGRGAIGNRRHNGWLKLGRRTEKPKRRTMIVDGEFTPEPWMDTTVLWICGGQDGFSGDDKIVEVVGGVSHLVEQRTDDRLPSRRQRGEVVMLGSVDKSPVHLGGTPFVDVSQQPIDEIGRKAMRRKLLDEQTLVQYQPLAQAIEVAFD